jgi:hypothetical protein
MLTLFLITALGSGDAYAHQGGHHKHKNVRHHRTHQQTRSVHQHRDFNRKPAQRRGGTWIWISGRWITCGSHWHWSRGYWQWRRTK